MEAHFLPMELKNRTDGLVLRVIVFGKWPIGIKIVPIEIKKGPKGLVEVPLGLIKSRVSGMVSDNIAFFYPHLSKRHNDHIREQHYPFYTIG